MRCTIANTSNHIRIFSLSLSAIASLVSLVPSVHAQQWCGVPTTDSFMAYEAEHVPSAPSIPLVSTTSDNFKIQVIYFVPKDRTNRINKVRRRIQRNVEDALQFFNDQRLIIGFGTKDLEAVRTNDGDVKIDQIIGNKRHADYESGGWWRSIGPEIVARRNIDRSIALVYIEKDTPYIDKPGWKGIGEKTRVLGGLAVVTVSGSYLPEWQIVAHEIGHVLGLRHNFNSPSFLMGYGQSWEKDQLAQYHGRFLDASRYFNSPSFDDGTWSSTIVKRISPKKFAYDARTDKTRLTFLVKDPDGISQILFLVHGLVGYACRR